MKLGVLGHSRRARVPAWGTARTRLRYRTRGGHSLKGVLLDGDGRQKRHQKAEGNWIVACLRHQESSLQMIGILTATRFSSRRLKSKPSNKHRGDFTLSTTFPTAALSDKTATLSGLGLQQDTVLVLKEAT